MNLERDDGGDRLTWRPATVEGKRTARAVCQCGVRWELDAYRISDLGTVTPALTCPRACGFQAYVNLDGWTP